jgi:hypothetical protein
VEQVAGHEHLADAYELQPDIWNNFQE